MAVTKPNSVFKTKSRYVQGGLTERYQNRLAWWERREFPREPTDLKTEVYSSESRRPDLVAYRIYGSADLAWFVLQYNNIIDVNTEFKPGTKLTLPTPQRLNLMILNYNTGGKLIGK